MLLVLALPAGAPLGLVYPGHSSLVSKCHKIFVFFGNRVSHRAGKSFLGGFVLIQSISAGHKSETVSCVPRQEEDPSSSSHSEMQCL